jgi:FkbM family methyltransferase
MWQPLCSPDIVRCPNIISPRARWKMTEVAHVSLDLGEGNTRLFYFRPGSGSDRSVVYQILQSRDYELNHFRRAGALEAYAQSKMNTGQRPLIIDAGANIGASPVYFSFRYPTSRVVAIEPEPNNCDLLRQNCASRDVVLLEGAIGSEKSRAFLFDPGLSDWGFRVGSTGSYAVTVFTVDEILNDPANVHHFPFICKIDIEGGEAALFERNTEWLERFPLVIIELHDWLLPGEGNSQNFFKALVAHDFDFVFRGENSFCFNNRLLVGY